MKCCEKIEINKQSRATESENDKSQCGLLALNVHYSYGVTYKAYYLVLMTLAQTDLDRVSKNMMIIAFTRRPRYE